MKHSELIAGLCELLRIGQLEPDSAGVYAIVFDDGLDVELLALSDSLLLVRSSVADLPDEDDRHEEFYRTHLQHNLLVLRDQTTVLSLDRESKKVWLHRVVPTKQTDVRFFCDQIEDFVNTIEWWRNWESQAQAQVTRAPQMTPYNMLRPLARR